MFAVDTNILIAHLQANEDFSTSLFKAKASREEVFIPPAVLAEYLSYPFLSENQMRQVQKFGLLSVSEDYWARAGLMRAELFKKGLKPKLPDTLIAQSCIDHDIPLLTRDTAFRQFAEHCGLRLVKAE
jgi:predicted nucleic acid-binding protein